MSHEDLRSLVATLPIIEQAKGILMAYYNIDSSTAFALLRRWSSTRNMKLSAVSAAITRAAARPANNPFESIRRYLRSEQVDGGPDASS